MRSKPTLILPMHAVVTTCILAFFFSISNAFAQEPVPVQTKFVRPDDVRFDLAKGDFMVEHYASAKEKNKGVAEKRKKSTYEIKNISGRLPQKVFEVLIELGYLDTTHHFFPDYKKNLKLDYVVHRIMITSIGASNLSSSSKEIQSEATITLKSQFGMPIFTREIKKVKNKNVDNEAELFYDSVYEIVKDFFLEQEVADFMKNDRFVDVPKVETSDKIKLKTNHVTGTDITNWADAVVTLMDSLGHGSGCIVSSDGYIITNYHVVAQKSSLQVKMHDGKMFEGKVLRYDPECDLALVKVEAQNLKTLQIVQSSGIGDIAFVVGTPVDTLLYQSVSKGIISGQRNYFGVDYLQTDANINSGNSGGALLSSRGELLGIVNAKYFGFGIEGIGFAIPAKYIGERLNVTPEVKVPISPIPEPKKISKGKK